MKARSIALTVAWIILILLLPLAALDAIMVLGGLFTMSNADTAVADNWIWLCAGPFSFLPALSTGILLASVFRIPVLKDIRGVSRHLVWPAIAWLSLGACWFTWIQLWGKGFVTELNRTFYLSRVTIPMLIAASCLWLVRIPRPIKNKIPLAETNSEAIT